MRIRRSLSLRNSELVKSPKGTIDKIADLLSEERISAEVDHLLDQAVQAFRLELDEPLSYSTFNQVVGEFIRHVYLTGLRLPRDLSKTEALTEAVSLLTRYYRGGYTEGYEGALLDAMSGNLEGLELVLSRLGESLKEVERNKYVNWVFADQFERLDWETKRQLVITYFNQYGTFLPTQLRELDPARPVDHFHALITDYVSSINLLKQVFKAK